MSADDHLPDWTPPACTLPTEQKQLRVAEFDILFRRNVTAVQRVGPTCLRLTLDGDDDLNARVLDLTRRERECCSFFTFQMSTASDGLHLEVQVPPQQAAVLDALTTRTHRLAPLRRTS